MPPDFQHYYAVQRECQNAALLQMVEASIAESSVVVKANPSTQKDAMTNLNAFSFESRLKQHKIEGVESTQISKIPRMRKCYGWLKLSGKTLCEAPQRMWAPRLEASKISRVMSFEKDYIAIVYECVEEGENDPTAVGEVLKFLWLAGFCHTVSPAARNWKSGVLVDLSDIVHPGGYWWSRSFYGEKDPERILIGDED